VVAWKSQQNSLQAALPVNMDDGFMDYELAATESSAQVFVELGTDIVPPCSWPLDE
jgi:hypothetical protein